MTISIGKHWFAATLVAAMAAPAAGAYPLAESGFSNPRAVETTVAAEHTPRVQSQITAIDRGARERAAERSAADAVPAPLPNTTIDRGARERAAERATEDAALRASLLVASASSNFQLRDAGIGAAVATGALMLGAAVALALIARTRRRAIHP